ncbi:radical SAM protein [Flavobacterium oreochromis]|uniref:radical SAM protein n=1 Tax=Flavobacterium oreochromis TaxID=2906078 RepID=UPI00385CC65F
MKKYSRFNSILPYQGKYALYNSLEQKFLFIERELKEILEASIIEGISNLKEIHPTFFEYLSENNFIINSNIDETEKLREISIKVDENYSTFLLTVNPTMNCNFKCWYCYETHIKDSKLDYSVLDSVKKFVTKTISKPEMEYFSLSFFGGEPLLYFKMNVAPLIDHLREECNYHNKKYSISFTTNGYLVNDYFIEYFKKYDMYASLQITLDGYKEEHDEVRFVNKKKGSYNEIIANIKKLLLNERFNITLRINYTDKNIHNCFKIINDFEDLPIEIKRKKLLIDFHRVWQNDQLDDSNKVLMDNISIMESKGFKTNMIYSPDNVKASCYADKRNSATINYNGDLFKCTARDFLSENRAGYISQEGDLIWENGYLDKRMDSKFKNKPCLTCRIMPLCNGGCTQHAMENVGKDYCVFHGDESEKDKVVLTKIEQILQENATLQEA